jgi:N-ethylmaleimide reductase
MDARAHNKLFVPVQVGAITLKHRVVMPPLSRLRAEWPSGVPSDLNVEYYSQRASDGGLIFTEATAVSPSARGYRGAPGIYSDEQVTGWRRATEAVHAKGGYMFVQLWHAGRTTHIAVTGEEPVTASVDPTYWADPSILVVTPDGFSQPSPHRALEMAEIAGIIEQYRAAALNAKKAGFDGVELMAANGHLIDQFLQDNSNKRTDRYGGSIENRARLMLDVTDAVVSVWGPGRVGMHLAPRADAHDMGDSDLPATFGHVVRELGKRKIAFICARESLKEPRLGLALKMAFGGVYVANEGFTFESATEALAAGEADAVAFGKLFIANPDLPRRFALKAQLNKWNSATFYAEGAEGYTDYPPLAEAAE